jgi:hypothetical protein
MKKLIQVLAVGLVSLLMVVAPVLAAPRYNPTSVSVARYAVSMGTDGHQYYRARIATAAVSGAYGYEYAYSADDGVTWKVLANSSSRTYISGNLLINGSQHKFRVRAYNSTSPRVNVIDVSDGLGGYKNIVAFPLAKQLIEPTFKTFQLNIPTVLKVMMTTISEDDTPIVGFLMYNFSSLPVTINGSTSDVVYQSGEDTMKELSLHAVDFPTLVSQGRLFVRPAASLIINPYEMAPVFFRLRNGGLATYNEQTMIKYSFTYDTAKYQAVYGADGDQFDGEFYDQ